MKTPIKIDLLYKNVQLLYVVEMNISRLTYFNDTWSLILIRLSLNIPYLLISIRLNQIVIEILMSCKQFYTTNQFRCENYFRFWLKCLFNYKYKLYILSNHKLYLLRKIKCIKFSTKIKCLGELEIKYFLRCRYVVISNNHYDQNCAYKHCLKICFFLRYKRKNNVNMYDRFYYTIHIVSVQAVTGQPQTKISYKNQSTGTFQTSYNSLEFVS